MTPQEIITSSQRMYNSVGSKFYPPEELLDYIYFAEMDLALKTELLQSTFSTTTVIDTREYDFPSTAMSIRKATFAGVPLSYIEFSEDDVLTGFREDTTVSGDPRYYTIWGNTLSLRPTPATADTLKLWTFDLPSKAAIGSTLETPAQYHPSIIYYVLSQMVRKDELLVLSDRYDAIWNAQVAEIKKSVQRRKRSANFSQVKDENQMQDFSFTMRL